MLLAPTSSPLVEDLLGRIVRRFPGARFTFDTPFSTTEVEQGGQLAFGVATQPIYDLTRARTLVSIESDFLADRSRRAPLRATFRERAAHGESAATR